MKLTLLFSLTLLIQPGISQATTQLDTLPEKKRLRGSETTRRGNLEGFFEEEDDPYSGMQDGDVIPGAYIVQLDDDKIDTQGQGRYRAIENFTKQRGIHPAVIYSHSISGFAVEHLPKGLVKFLEADSAVLVIEEDRVVRLSQCKSPEEPCTRDDECCSGQCTKGKPSERKCENPSDPPPDSGPGDSSQTIPAGISRVGGGGNYTGNNVAWVIDTGIDLDHEDLNVDVALSFSAYDRKEATVDDRNGHGTHVAGTIAAIDNSVGVVGVAAGATVVPVKVLTRQGWGTWSAVIAGVDHVAENGKEGDVANMSLGGGFDGLVNKAVELAAEKGIYFTLAAGNEGQDAGDTSPASATGDNIMTIAAMDESDGFASFSNYGDVVDGCQPGVAIFSTYINNGYTVMSGTSMAAPHMAGVLLMMTEKVSGELCMTGQVNGFQNTNVRDHHGNTYPVCIIQ